MLKVEIVRLLEESVLIQGTVTLMLVTAVVYMYVTGHSVPNELTSILLLVLGFYFGGKTNTSYVKGVKYGTNAKY